MCKPEEGVKSPGAGLQVVVNFPTWVLGSELCKSRTHSELLGHLSIPNAKDRLNDILELLEFGKGIFFVF